LPAQTMTVAISTTRATTRRHRPDRFTGARPGRKTSEHLESTFRSTRDPGSGLRVLRSAMCRNSSPIIRSLMLRFRVERPRTKRALVAWDRRVLSVVHRHHDSHRHAVLDQGDDLPRSTQPWHRVAGDVKVPTARTSHPQHPAIGGHPNRQQANLVTPDETHVVADFLGSRVLAAAADSVTGHPYIVSGRRRRLLPGSGGCGLGHQATVG
jgi:hypothetical protein